MGDREKVAKALAKGVDVRAVDESMTIVEQWAVREAVRMIGRAAVWEYYLNDEGRARWRCSACGKIIRHGAQEKRFCSSCGAEMKMEC